MAEGGGGDDEQLKYSIYKCSSYSSNFVPENILEDKPSDQNSRWSSDSNNPSQFLILKLERPSIVKKITFGKYEKNHVCNIKKFSVYGGLSDENTLLLLQGVLKNDSIPETFTLRHKVAEHEFPVRFVKIVPHQAWGATFNFSIWHVALHGCQNWGVVQKCINWYAVYQEREAVRLCLKHLRKHNYTDAFESLSQQSHVQLEDPLLTQLHESLVRDGNFEMCEQIIAQGAQDGLFEHYVKQQDYKPHWMPILPLHSNGSGRNHPGMRGGHQMCIDSYNQAIYLFGGWNGTEDLSDLWVYSIANQEWTCISRDTQREGGPCARSCHKMCLDPERRQIFTLGRYVDNAARVPENLKGDFYMYDIDSNKWVLINEDTASAGGPSLIFDHQMVMDVEKRVIYVFGGRVLSTSRWEGIGMENYTPRELIFSGLYSYHVATSTWTKLRDDCGTSSTPKPNEIKSRYGHSMLFHSGTRQLFILAGQRNKEYLLDFFTYSIDTDTITYINDGSHKDSTAVPATGFTQKAMIDCNLNEIYVLSGISKDKCEDNIRNTFWVYSITENKWSCIYNNDQGSSSSVSKNQPLEPCPRFAHQLVYDDVKKVHYLFGGNPGRKSQLVRHDEESKSQPMRLDDFWSLKLSRPTSEHLLHNSIFMIRKHRFRELSLEDSVAALNYLQTSLHDAVDHSECSQVKEFQSLASVLFQAYDPTTTPPSLALHLYQSQADTCHSVASSFEVEGSFEAGAVSQLSSEQLKSWKHHMRSQLFDQLMQFFPEEMTQPRANLTDLIPY